MILKLQGNNEIIIYNSLYSGIIELIQKIRCMNAVIVLYDYKHPNPELIVKSELSDENQWISLNEFAYYFQLHDGVMLKILRSWLVNDKEIAFTVCSPGCMLDGAVRHSNDFSLFEE